MDTPIVLPEGFKFVPQGGVVQGPAYSKPFKALALVMMAVCVLAVLSAQSKHDVLTDASGRGMLGLSSGALWIFAALAMMAYTVWQILTSTTRIDAQTLQQSWVWNKQIPMSDLVYAKLIRMRGLDWLIAPRLYVRTVLGKFAVFYVADPLLLAQAELLVKALESHRNKALGG